MILCAEIILFFVNLAFGIYERRWFWNWFAAGFLLFAIINKLVAA